MNRENINENEFIHQRQMAFNRFLDAQSDTGYYQRVESLLEEKKSRLAVNLSDLRAWDPNEAKFLLERPMECIPAYEAALKQVISEFPRNEKEVKTQETRYTVAIEGSFGAQRMGPREMMADNLTRLVCVEGIVTKCSLVRPKVMQTVHYCEKTGEFHTHNFRDATSFSGAPTGAAYPKTDDNGNRLTTEYGLSTYKNHQKVYIQDMPERTAAGTMPRTIECIVEDDLVDQCKPGDRIKMIGVYRALQRGNQGESSGRFRTVVIANNVKRIGRDETKREMTAEDIHNIRHVLKKHNKDLFNVCARSMAPTIYGHDYIKKAVMLMMLGGCEKNLKNGTHIRGDINILMVGDPSTAKSQLLRAVMQMGNLVINTTGRGSSGVGLTAAVTTDRDSGERRLEAGAMVLADRGIVCIDEFDKMSDADRTAIHEVMEQQTVTIAKAGIHTSLNARCSVIAASNPIYGQYNRSMPPAQNIALPDSLLSRFDLLFIVLDKLDPRIDRAISEHVLRMHRYQGQPNDDEDDDSENDEEGRATEVYEKRDKLLQGAAASLRKGKEKVRFLTSDFLKKFIQFAKTKAAENPPRLTDEAREEIAQRYAELRGHDGIQTLPITARCLETMIRLASAHAKLRISSEITIEDVKAVFEVLNFALTHDAAPSEGDGAASGAAMELEDNDEDMIEDGEDGMGSPPPNKGKRKKPDDHMSPDRMKSAAMGSNAPGAARPARRNASGVTAAVIKFLVDHFRQTRKTAVETSVFVDLCMKNSEFGFSARADVNPIIEEMKNQGKIFVTNDKIYRI